MKDTHRIYQGVKMGSHAVIGEFAVVGLMPRGHLRGTKQTVIGVEAHLRSNTVIYAGSDIGSHLHTGHGAIIREGCRIGSHVSVGSHTVIEPDVKIEDNVRILDHAFIPRGTILEDSCWIGPHVVINSSSYPGAPGVKARPKSVSVRAGAKIGANATIMPGVDVGKDALIGAGAVVTRSVAEAKIVGGNPARELKDVTDITTYFKG